jgi:hypothetical protein
LYPEPPVVPGISSFGNAFAWTLNQCNRIVIILGLCVRVFVHLTNILYRPVVGYNSKPRSHRGYVDCTVP